jgi:hypothetical protein
MADNGNNNTANFEAVIGVTGCGKSTVLKKRIRKLPAAITKRSLIWSPKEAIDKYAEFYPNTIVTSSVMEVIRILDKAGPKGGFHIVFVPTLDEKKDRAAFSAVCKAALAARNILFVVEELHSVTQAGNAPHGWRLVNFMGRGFGLYVFGLSQRPASMDKAFLGSLSWLHVGELPHPPDQKVASQYLGVPVQEVAALCGYQAIQKEFRTKKLTYVK